MGNLGAADIDSRLEEQLIDGILFAFQEQTSEVSHTPFLSYHLSTSFTIIFSLTHLSGCDHVEWFWCGGKCSGNACQALPASNLWYHSLEAQQQGRQSATAGR